MPFTSFSFIIFLAAVFAVYFLVPKRFQWLSLLAASWVFYLIAGPRYVPYLAFTTLSTFCAGAWLGALEKHGAAKVEQAPADMARAERQALKEKTARHKKRVLAAALLANFGALGMVKYLGFIGANLSAFLNDLSLQISLPGFDFILPLGISFYTFQAMGYLIDVYRAKYAPEQNLARFSLFTSFFPQMVQGPIGRYDALAPQLYAPHSFDYERTKHGVQLMIWGFFKKLVIADRAAVIVNTVIGDYTRYNGLFILIAIVLYAIQIYTDFSGGIDIATGAAQVMGIDLAANFKRPYLAQSVPDYWRRWHITLGAWMRDYLYYPLALSKKFASIGRFLRKTIGKRIGMLFPVLMAEAIVFLVIGVWHGPAWRYIAYGAYYGCLIVLGLLLRPFGERVTSWLHINTNCFSWRLWRVARTFSLTCLARYLTRAPSLWDTAKMIRLTISGFSPAILFDGSLYTAGLDARNWLLLLVAVLVLAVVGLLQERGYRIREKLAEQNLAFQWGSVLAGILVVLVFGMYGPGFDATKFIYEMF